MLWAIKNGVPPDKAETLDEAELLSWGIIFAQFENGNQEFDWDRMCFMDNK